MTGVLINTGKFDTGTQGDHHVMTKAEMRLRHLQAEEHPTMASELPDARAEAWRIAPHSPEGTNPADTLTLDFQPTEV